MKKIFIYVVLFSVLLSLAACTETGQTVATDDAIHIHEYGEWTTEAATCTANGSRWRVCECGDRQSEILLATGHDLKHRAKTAATCTSEGNVEYWYCANCGNLYTDRTTKKTITQKATVLARTAHSYIYRKATPSDCRTRGWKEHLQCTECNGLFAVEGQNALSESDVYLPLAAHDLTRHARVESTCLMEGNIEYYSCSVCGRNFTDEEGTEETDTITVAKQEHRYENGVCSECGEKNSFTVRFDARGGSAIEPIEVLKNTAMEVYPLSYRSGNVFCGWYAADGSPYLPGDAITADITFHARWLTSEQAYMVLPLRFSVVNNAFSSDFAVNGYRLENFYTDVTCEKQASTASHRQAPYLFVKFNPLKITVTLRAGGGYFEGDPNARQRTMTVDYYTEYVLPLPHKTGSTVTGWTADGENYATDAVFFMDSTAARSYDAVYLDECTHDFSRVPAVEATCLTDGNIEYYRCALCLGCFADEEGAVEEWDVTSRATGHSGGVANCKEPATCSRCGADYGAPITHGGGMATCIALAVCDFCGEEYGEFADHRGGKATCTHGALCEVCGQAYGDPDDHEGKIVCGKGRVCDACGEVYDTSDLAHTYENGKCSVCGATENLSVAYKEEVGGYFITGIGGSAVEEIVFPAWESRYPVVGVSKGAFFGNTTLKTVRIPATMTYFDDNAFYGCSGLNAVYIEDLNAWQSGTFVSEAANPLTYAGALYLNGKRVTQLSIGVGSVVSKYAFSGLDATSAELAVGVTYVGAYAFTSMTRGSDLYVRQDDLSAWDSQWAEGCGAQLHYGYDDGFASEEYGYRLVNNKVFLLSYLGDETKVVVPDEIGGRPVADIGLAFAGKTLTSLFLPRHITTTATYLASIGSENVYYPASYEEWKANGNPDADNVRFLIERECIHKNIHCYRYDGSDIVHVDIAPDDGLAHSCLAESLTEGVRCVTCGEFMNVEYDCTRAHLYEGGVCTVCGETEPSALTYEVYGEGYAVARNASASGAIVIPSLWQGKAVLKINEGAFAETEITSVFIPRSVRFIGQNAFRDCALLTDVYYDAESCAEREGSYFSGCSSLTVVIGANARMIPAHLFYLSDVTELTFENGSRCEKIGDFAFAACAGLTSLTLPASMKTIGFGAFRNCVGLIELNAPQSVLSIGRSAFAGCGALTAVTTADRLIGAHETAFLRTAWYNALPNGVVYLGKTAVFYKGTPDRVILREDALYVGEKAFYATAIESIVLPAGLRAIGKDAFRDCTRLVEIHYFAETLSDADAEDRIFFNTGSNLTLYVGSNVTYLPENLVYGVSNVTNVTEQRSRESVSVQNGITYEYYDQAVYGSVFAESGDPNTLSKSEKVTIPDQTTERFDAVADAFQTALAAGENATGEKEFMISGELAEAVAALYGSAAEGVLISLSHPLSFTTRQYYGKVVAPAAQDLADYYEKDGETYRKTEDVELAEKDYYRLLTYADYVGLLTSLLGYSSAAETTEATGYLARALTSEEAKTADRFLFAAAVRSGERFVVPFLVQMGNDARQVVLFVDERGAAAWIARPEATFIASEESSYARVFGRAYLFERGAVEDMNVERVGRKAFYGTAWLAARQGVVYIGKSLYLVKSNAREIVIADGTLSVCEEAFAGCTSLQTLTIPSSVLTIGETAFEGCTGITTVYFNATHLATLTEKTALPVVGGASGWTLYIGSDADKLPAGLFYGTKGLKEIIFEQTCTVRTIESHTFASCPDLVSVTFHDALKVISDYAFVRCEKLNKVSFGSGLETLSGLSFAYCPLTELTSTSTVYVVAGGNLIDSEQSVLVLGANVFSSAGGAVTVVADYAFYGRPGLTEVVTDEYLYEIGAYAFACCPDLTTVRWAYTVEVGERAFSDCADLHVITYACLSVAPLSASSQIFAGSGEDVYLTVEGASVLPDNLFAGTNAPQPTKVILGIELTSIGENALTVAEDALVLYEGTSDEWSAVVVAAGNVLPVSSEMWFFTELPPPFDPIEERYIGQYWHYVEDAPTLWIYEAE